MDGKKFIVEEGFGILAARAMAFRLRAANPGGVANLAERNLAVARC
jgi:hypothetical protein